MRANDMIDELCFVHVPKTGGSSIREALNRLARQYEVDLDNSTSRNNATASGNVKNLATLDLRQRVTVIGHNHRVAGYTTFPRYLERVHHTIFSFSFVRNPYDRAVSVFHFLKAGGLTIFDRIDSVKFNIAGAKTFSEFVDAHFVGTNPEILTQTHFRPQVHWICGDSGRPLTNFVGRFEEMASDLDKILPRFGWRGVAPHCNKSRHGPYSSYYNRRTRDIIGHFYRDDFSVFGYSLEMPLPLG